MSNKHSDELDRIIDCALASYSEAMPQPGLQERVRNYIRTAEAQRRKRTLMRAALPFAAALLFAAIVLRTTHDSTPKIAVVERPSVRPTITKPALAESDFRMKTATRRASRSVLLPKKQRFPTAAPLTSGERALLALVGRYPVETEQMIADMQKRINDAIDVAPIQIPPLQSDGVK